MWSKAPLFLLLWPPSARACNVLTARIASQWRASATALLPVHLGRASVRTCGIMAEPTSTGGIYCVLLVFGGVLMRNFERLISGPVGFLDAGQPKPDRPRRYKKVITPRQTGHSLAQILAFSPGRKGHQVILLPVSRAGERSMGILMEPGEEERTGLGGRIYRRMSEGSQLS